MSDPTASDAHALAPLAPPSPPGRLGQLQRIMAPWGKNIGPKPPGGGGREVHDRTLHQISRIHAHSPRSAYTATHKTGIPIAALDINEAGTHAVLAGKEILKTVRVDDGKVSEDLNLRASVNAFAATDQSPRTAPEGSSKRREYLPARDVRWSKGQWAHIVATAATSGRIALYDLNALGPKTELAWLHEHTGQINKLDFDPFAGYLLLSASQDKSVRLWDLREPKIRKSRVRFDVRNAVRDVRWSPSDALDFAVCADGGVIQKWDARAPLAPKLSISGHEKACYSLDWHPDGRHLISGGFDKYVRVWDLQSDNRRQKPVLQLRAPHAIRNIRWRPPSRVASASDGPAWQSTQVAASYYHDDPRLHIWDLRRPWLPYCELDCYATPANDLLWANQDMLWTVGDEGIFTQWDLQHANVYYRQLPPCASTFFPDGQFGVFAEDREGPHDALPEHVADGLLTIPGDKLSGGDYASASRSLTDDEGSFEPAMKSSGRKQMKITHSSRSTKSQANSPPSTDGRTPMIPLDKAVSDKPDWFENEQVGAVGHIPGHDTQRELVEYLAVHYATPASAAERMQAPDLILTRLQQTFDRNAAVCDTVSLHQMAQSWRILGAIIVPELKDWADSNRANRRADASRRRDILEKFRSGAHRPGLSPLAGLPVRGHPTSKGEAKPQTLMSSLLKGMVTGERLPGSDPGSTSNMTTPLAKPLPSSPLEDQEKMSQIGGEESLDDIPPLPPSLLASHSTAASASRALIDTPGSDAKSNDSSPVASRSADAPAQPAIVPQPATTSQSSGSKAHISSSSSELAQIMIKRPSRDDRRAALRDYRVSARPIFTLDDTAERRASDNLPDSGESFPMFSASTDSSRRARSFGYSLESPGGSRAAEGYGDDDDRDRRGGREGSPADSEGDVLREAKPESSGLGTDADGLDSPLDISLGPSDDGLARISKVVDDGRGLWNVQIERGSDHLRPLDTNGSSSPDLFHFEQAAGFGKARIHTTNPIRIVHPHPETDDDRHVPAAPVSSSITMDELDCEGYLSHDFRPIDLSLYEPKLPFAWSSLPLICQSIAFDLEHGMGHGQFAAHLLMHVHPYFFHPSFRTLAAADGAKPESLAERLMTPRLGHRVIECIFQNHVTFLSQMGLFDCAALVRTMSVEFEYPKVYETPVETSSPSTKLSGGNARTASIGCSSCSSLMPAGGHVCERCRRARPPCPICLSLGNDVGHLSAVGASDGSPAWGFSGGMWMLCQACGHSGHVGCLMEWFSRPFSDGTCPSPGCGCDCGPGVGRDERIQRQARQVEEAKLLRGSLSGMSAAKKDSLRARTSPAVDKARAALRRSEGGGGERATQSSDERRPGRQASIGSQPMSGLGASRKSVRLITPGEED